MSEQLSIAVIGAGAVGSYYGGRLAEAGHDVRFLMRRDYDAVKENGLQLTSPVGDFVLPNPNIARESTEIGPVDWVICALKATSIGDAQRLVQPCVKATTRILVLMNGLGIEERFAQWFDSRHIFGGMAFTCVNRGEPGYVHHMAYGPVTIGHFHNDPVELEMAIQLWSKSKAQISAAPSLLRARWEKLCWNIPFNGLAVAAGGITSDRIVGNPALRNAARTLMEEVIAAGNADLVYHSEQARIDRDAIMDLMFVSTDAMGVYRPSTMIDFVEGKAMEIEAMFGEPLRRAQLLGVETPQLALLTAVLHALNAKLQGSELE